MDKDFLGNCNVPSNVTVIPPLEQGQLLPYYQRARVYCQSSIREGLSNALCEAMLCECIPVATDVGGNADLVTTGSTGQIVPAGDPEGLAHQIVQLANNPDQAKQMGQLGRQRVEEKFSMNAMVAAYLGTYDKLLGRAGVSA